MWKSKQTENIKLEGTVHGEPDAQVTASGKKITKLWIKNKESVYQCIGTKFNNMNKACAELQNGEKVTIKGFRGKNLDLVDDTITVTEVVTHRNKELSWEWKRSIYHSEQEMRETYDKYENMMEAKGLVKTVFPHPTLQGVDCIVWEKKGYECFKGTAELPEELRGASKSEMWKWTVRKLRDIKSLHTVTGRKGNRAQTRRA